MRKKKFKEILILCKLNQVNQKKACLLKINALRVIIKALKKSNNKII